MKLLKQLIGLFFFWYAIPAQAADFNVNNVNGLIQAIYQANTTSEPDTIRLTAGTYNMTQADSNSRGGNGLPWIITDITIIGEGSNKTTLKRVSSEVFRFFLVTESGSLTLEKVALVGGECDASADGFNGGGAILNFGATHLVDVAVTGNKAAYGGGITNDNVMTLTRTTISGNQAFQGGGLANSKTMTLIDSIITDNTSTSDYGGGGGIYNPNYGAWPDGVLSLINTTISNNKSLGSAGGLWNQGKASILNSTFSGNSASAYVGAIWNYAGIVEISSSTIQNNNSSPFPFSSGRPDELRIKNSIISNCSESLHPGSVFISQGYNIDSDDSCNLSAVGDISGVDPLLGPLQINGGVTPTHALLAGSPAIDAGDNINCPSNDQRRFIRPHDGDNNGSAECDIGAYEAGFVAGDLNGDSCIDKTDLTTILAIINGPNPKPLFYDLNGDGKVNIADSRKLVTLFTNPLGAACIINKSSQ